MIRLFYFQSPNAFKILIALEELELEFEERGIDILNGEQMLPAFLAINPNNKVPAIEDLAPADGGGPLAVFESGAILLYLAEKTGKLLPAAARARSDAVQWLIWQAANQGPQMGQLVHYTTVSAATVPYAIERHSKEVERIFGVMDRRLADREFLAGDYSMADIMNYPWLRVAQMTGIRFDHFPNISRWVATMEVRPAVKRALSPTRLESLEQAVEKSRPREM